MKNLKVGKFPGKIYKVEVQETATVADVINTAVKEGMPSGTADYLLKVNGSVCDDFNDTPADGAVIIMSKKIKGNCDDMYEVDGEEYFADTAEELLECIGASELYDAEGKVISSYSYLGDFEQPFTTTEPKTVVTVEEEAVEEEGFIENSEDLTSTKAIELLSEINSTVKEYGLEVKSFLKDGNGLHIRIV